ncbi:ATP-dependent DNA helicase RecG [bacterium]|nr:ATP-dependent DNA helicase RecG [bacterium]
MESLSWNSPLILLFKKETDTYQRLIGAGYKTIFDLLWITPLNIDIIPPTQSFDKAVEGEIFQGEGLVINVQRKPSFNARGKKGIRLSNLDVLVRDSHSENLLNLKWFNAYPSVYKVLSEAKKIIFHGKLTIYGSQKQIAAPSFSTKLEVENQKAKTKINYPTVNGIKPHLLSNLFKRIPTHLWENIPESLPSKISEKRQIISFQKAIRTLHGKIEGFESLYDIAIETLIYYEFFDEQVKILLRKEKQMQLPAEPLSIDHKYCLRIEKNFDYKFTSSQKNSINDIISDLKSGHQMMRLIQGDVGCGKTTVALVSAILVIEKSFQVAIMCPTESLAFQHFLSTQKILKSLGIQSCLLVGSLKTKEKKKMQDDISKGVYQLIIGTHSLIQKSVIFKSLKLCIIDEQHKFGVNQRLELTRKGHQVHSLIMTATPIPRSLCLTQYGDLDISIIDEMPNKFKSIKTKIVTTENFQKFLSFLKTRLSLKEQAYIVVPAIEDNPESELLNLEKVYSKFKKIFPEYRVSYLHGKMDAQEKSSSLKLYLDKKIDILICTSVVEVGINAPSASIMTIFNPERFGLSSLHQLRGRVGRGESPGFCFLILDRSVSEQALGRLKIIEKSNDGFLIAEEDLKIRGQGDLFGKNQSGNQNQKRFANAIIHSEILIQAREDVFSLAQNNSKEFKLYLEHVKKDSYVTQTT